MFGIRIAIGAVDNTTKATRDIAQKLQKFGSKVNSLINLGGMVIAFRKVGQAIDKAFNASTYSKEWGDFKDTFSQGFADIAGRVADSWGPMLDTAKSWAETIVGAFEKVVEKIQYAGAYMGALMSGEGFSGAAKMAQETVDALRKATEERKKQQAIERQSVVTASIAREKATRDEPIDARELRTAAQRQGYIGRGMWIGESSARKSALGFGGNWGRKINDKTAARIDAASDEELAAMAGGVSLERAQRHVARRVRMGVREERAIAGLSPKMRAAMELSKRHQESANIADHQRKVDEAALKSADSLKNIEAELVGSGAGGK